MTDKRLQTIQLPEAGKREEITSVGVYFLFGEPEEAAKSVVHSGEAEDCYKRFMQHNANKDLWHTAVAIVSKTGSFTKAHAKYLEWHCIKQTKQVARFQVANGNEGGDPFVTDPMHADLAGQVRVTVEAESPDGFDKGKLQTGVLEPLRDADLIECCGRPCGHSLQRCPRGCRCGGLSSGNGNRTTATVHAG
jgi:hypothetical protein